MLAFFVSLYDIILRGLQKNSNGNISLITCEGGDKGIYSFLKGISHKANVIELLEIELVCRSPAL